MKSYHLFIDGSVDPNSKIGFGSYLLLENLDVSLPEKEIKSIRFEDTSSTKIELELIIHVLKDLQRKNINLLVYTDSNAIVSLPGRKERLIKTDYYSRKMRRLSLHYLYQEFFGLYDPLHCEFLKLKGHSRSIEKDRFDQYFSAVDKASRRSLRNFLKEKDNPLM